MRRFLLIIALLLAGIAPMQTMAQKETPDEVIRLTVGDIFQILAVSDTPNAKYSWILEKNDTFVEAGREKDFRTRIIIPGKYTLRVDETNGNGIVASRLFAVNVVSQDEASSKSAKAPDGSLAAFDPPLSDSSVVLDDQSQVVRVAPATSGKALILDLDRQADSDDDGNPADDQDTVDTFLAADGTPLYLWIPHLTGKREMLVREDPPTAAAQQMQIVTTQYAQSNSIVRGQLDIIADQTDGLTVRFSSKFKGTAPKAPLLYRWSFGDEEESLQQNPEHTYAQSGTYTVGLRTLDVRTGENIAEREEVLTIDSAETDSGTSASSASSSESSESSSVSSAAGTTSSSSASSAPSVPKEGFWSGVGMRAFLIALGVFIVAAIIGAVIVFAMRMLRGGSDSLQARLEKIDSSMKSSGAPVPMDTTTPLKMRKDSDATEKTERIEKVIETTAQKAPEEPKVDIEKAPSWLKKGLGEKDDTSSSPPVPDWLKPRPADAGGIPDPAIITEPVPAPVPAPAPQSPAPVPTAPVAPAPLPTVTVVRAPAPAAPAAPVTPAPVPTAPAPVPPRPEPKVPVAPIAPVAPVAPKAPTPPAAPATPVTPAPVPPRPAPKAPSPAAPAAPVTPVPAPTVPAPVPPRPAPKAPPAPATPVAPKAPTPPAAPASPVAPAPVPPRPAPKAPAAPAAPAVVTPPAAEPTEKPAPVATPNQTLKDAVPATVAVKTPAPAPKAPAIPKTETPKAPVMPARPAMEKPAKTESPAPLPQRPAAPAVQKPQTPAPVPTAPKPASAPKPEAPKPQQPKQTPPAPKPQAQAPVVPVRPPKETPKAPVAPATPSAGAFPPALPQQPKAAVQQPPKTPAAPAKPAPQSPAPAPAAQDLPSDQTIAIVRADSIIKESGEIPRVDDKKPNA